MASGRAAASALPSALRSRIACPLHRVPGAIVGIVPVAGVPRPGRAPRRSAVRRSLGFAQRCQPEVRRSKPSPRFFTISGTRSRGAASSAQVSRSRAMPAGDRRSAVARHHVRRRYAVSAVARHHAVGDARSRGPCRPRCRPEVGAPSRPRASSQSAVRDLVAQRRRRRFRAPARCRPETGAPLTIARHHVRRWYEVSAVARHLRGWRWEFRPPARDDAGLKTGAPIPCRPVNANGDEPPAARRAAVPTGGRRSKPSPRSFTIGGTRSRGAEPTGERLTAANSVRCPPDRGESVKGGPPPPFHNQ